MRDLGTACSRGSCASGDRGAIRASGRPRSTATVARGDPPGRARAWIRYFPLDVGKRRVWTSIVEPYLLWTHHRFVVRCRNGARMAGDTVEVHQQFLYFFGIHEPNLTAWMRRQLCDGVLVDVGAHIGYYALLGSRLLERGEASSPSNRHLAPCTR